MTKRAVLGRVAAALVAASLIMGQSVVAQPDQGDFLQSSTVVVIVRNLTSFPHDVVLIARGDPSVWGRGRITLKINPKDHGTGNDIVLFGYAANDVPATALKPAIRGVMVPNGSDLAQTPDRLYVYETIPPVFTVHVRPAFDAAYFRKERAKIVADTARALLDKGVAPTLANVGTIGSLLLSRQHKRDVMPSQALLEGLATGAVGNLLSAGVSFVSSILDRRTRESELRKTAYWFRKPRWYIDEAAPNPPLSPSSDSESTLSTYFPNQTAVEGTTITLSLPADDQAESGTDLRD